MKKITLAEKLLFDIMTSISANDPVYHLKTVKRTLHFLYLVFMQIFEVDVSTLMYK